MRIGDGAVIGARSVITKDVEPYSVVVGNNHMVKKRFDDESIEILERIQWWNCLLSCLKVRCQFFAVVILRDSKGIT
ncbi:acetyltransferase [Vibrio sp. JCM 19236]|nr:acetyltransferase [Vibrio sp. JCM 19236]